MMIKKIISSEILNEMYDEMLDDQGVIKIGTLEYYPSYVLSKVDPIAYNCGISDYYDSIRDEYICEDYE